MPARPRPRLATDVLGLRLEAPFDPEASEGQDVSGLQTAVPPDTDAVPQDHADAPGGVLHLQHRLDGDGDGDGERQR